MKLLIGGDSEIGAATYDFLVKRGEIVSATTRRYGDNSKRRLFLDLESLGAFTPPAETRSACILAGIARPSDCEADPRGSAHINVKQTLNLIERLLAQGLHVVFLSSNRVFDGSIPFTPADSPMSPICEYGRQKARLEGTLSSYLSRGAPLAILRLTKVVSVKAAPLAGWINALSRGERITALHDLVVAPLPIGTAALAIATLLREEARGLFQLSGPQDCPYADVASYIAEGLSVDTSLVTRASANGASLPTGSIRPHTTLDSARIRELCGVAAPDARTVVDRIVAEWATCS